MTDIIDKASGSVNLGELSKQNGKTEFENFKMIMELLALKVKFQGIPQKVVVSFPKEK